MDRGIAKAVWNATHTSGTGGIAGVRRWGLRLALVTLVPVMLLGVIEASLRLVGYGYPTEFFVRTEDGTKYTANSRFTWQFYPRETATQPFPFLMEAKKSPRTFRIFILGESAAAGTPDPTFGFARILQVILSRQYPTQSFEVVNAAVRGINSHIVRRIAQECSSLEPDCFVVYLGNNEAVGLYSPEPGRFNFARYPSFLRASERLRAMRVGQLLQSALRKLTTGPPGATETQNMEFFRARRLAADDPLRAAVYQNFRLNLRDICRWAESADAKVILSTVGSNLKDFPPLASLHRRDLSPSEKGHWERAYGQGLAAESTNALAPAIEAFEAAAKLDDHFADLQFRLGRCYLAAGSLDKARKHFTSARDWDALPFRTDSRLNGLIRQFAAENPRPGLQVVDVEHALAESGVSTVRIPGRELFLDHVHFNFDGDYFMARTLAPALGATLGLAAPAAGFPSNQECADVLAFTAWDQINVAAAMARMTSKPPFVDQIDHAIRQRAAEQAISNRSSRFTRQDLDRTVAVYRAAIARDSNDWQLHYNFGNLLSEMGDPAAAALEFETAMKAVPHFLPLRLALGTAWMQAGRSDLARSQFERAVAIDRHSRPAREAMRQLEAR